MKKAGSRRNLFRRMFSTPVLSDDEDACPANRNQQECTRNDVASCGSKTEVSADSSLAPSENRQPKSSTDSRSLFKKTLSSRMGGWFKGNEPSVERPKANIRQRKFQRARSVKTFSTTEGHPKLSRRLTMGTRNE